MNISEINLVDDKLVKLSYDFDGHTECKLLILEENNKLFGIWEDGTFSGEMEIVFKSDFNQADGWWKFSEHPKRYPLKIIRKNLSSLQ